MRSPSLFWPEFWRIPGDPGCCGGQPFDPLARWSKLPASSIETSLRKGVGPMNRSREGEGMEFEAGMTRHGFRLVEARSISEIDSRGLLFEHVRSGARLVKFENRDDDKVFMIGFRTPPPDSTGLPHILEHSVLCGSRKFPSKEPFVALLKGSLKTFLNAFTSPDRTGYPVASRNAKDFTNLMDVYLDAVLYPRLLEDPRILMQEGWHHELDEPGGEVNYKGVVYNEMRGAYSMPESLLFRRIKQSLFPDTAYGVDSGGDPDVIPELTQERFAAFHRRFYHPIERRHRHLRRRRYAVRAGLHRPRIPLCIRPQGRGFGPGHPARPSTVRWMSSTNTRSPRASPRKARST